MFAPLALQIITVIAVIAMFALVWGPRSDDSDLHGREQGGVEYVAALNKLLPVLVDAQSTAVQGNPVAKDSFKEPLDAVAAVDEKFGSDFGTSNRWSGLRARIETLPEQGGEGLGAFKNFGEATDLLLALYQQVAQASGLRNDGDGVISYLQDAALEEIPAAIVWSGRYQDQVVITSALTPPDRNAPQETYNSQAAQISAAFTELAVSRQVASEAGGDVASDMAAAVDNSGSGTFSTTLLQSLDEFQRGIEALAPPGEVGLSTIPRVADVAKQRAAAQKAAVELDPLLLDELSSQIDDRKGSADTGRVMAIALLAIAILATVASLLFLLVSARRSRSETVEAPPAYEHGNLDYSGYPGGSQPPGGSHSMGADPYRDAGRDARRERVGVPR
ncbi:hypothetical protein [Cryptosporangium minutisporangium]|uniref:hypothetical protein n=1 Tax=Cryptosporangium minutisporangium TaxID=113569 RepID=UPI0031EAAAAF